MTGTFRGLLLHCLVVKPLEHNFLKRTEEGIHSASSRHFKCDIFALPVWQRKDGALDVAGGSAWIPSSVRFLG